MPSRPRSTRPEPTELQRRAIDHDEGSLVVFGIAGSGRTEALAARIARLTDLGEGVLAVAATSAGALELRKRAEERVTTPFEEVLATTHRGAALRLLSESAAVSGADPHREALDPAERLAMLLHRLEELPLRRHEIRGAPAGLLGRLVERIDALRRAGVDPEGFRAWSERRLAEAASPADRDRAEREAEFADIYSAHDAMLGELGATDEGLAVLELCRALRDRPAAAETIARRRPHLIVDELEQAGPAELRLLGLLAGEASSVVVACDPGQASADSGDWERWIREALPGAGRVGLDPCWRFGGELIDAAHAISPPSARGPELQRRSAGPETTVRFTSCANERAEGQAAARAVAGLLASDDVEPGEICVAIPDHGETGRSVAAALEERGIPYRLGGPGTFFRRPEIRDVLAWLRLLADPTDAPAAVRVLSRAPVGLRSVDLARCTTIARRRKLDMVSALEAALESPQITPEARERIGAFLDLYGAAARAMAEMSPDMFVRRLIERVGFRRQRLFAAHPEAAERLRSLSRLGEIAARWARREPSGSNADFVRHLVAISEFPGAPDQPGPTARRAVSVLPAASMRGMAFDHVFVTGMTAELMPGPEPAEGGGVPEELGGRTIPHDEAQRRLLYMVVTRARRSVTLSCAEESDGSPARPSPFYEQARTVLGADEERADEELFGPAEGLHATYRMISDEVLEEAWRAGGGLNEPRLDTYLDVNRAVARFLELVKLAALLQRPGHEEGIGAEAIEAVNDLLAQGASGEQRAELAASALDAYLVDTERDRRRRRELIAERDQPSLEAFLPRRGAGLALSASDIDLYRTCPLKYKFARVFGIPQEPTINQRFGIVMHQALERFHREEGPTTGEGSLDRLLGLFAAAWRRAGFGTTDDELQFRERADRALRRYHERQSASGASPRWIERKFDFQVDDHHLRGRVDRVDELPGGGYELIDYKTGSPKSRAELEGDLQLAIYRLAAREAWDLEAGSGSYWYVLADEKVEVESAPDERERVERAVLEAGEGILGQDFEPRPSPEICSWCDFRVICPASEARAGG